MEQEQIKVSITLPEGQERITRDSLLITIAGLMGHRSTCKRAKVGCVITSDDHRIISSGHNGSLAGENHCSDKTCNIDNKCTHAVHAEANAIAYAAKDGIKLEGGILYCEYAPCVECAKLIISAGIARVVYNKEYRLTEGIELLEKHGVKVDKHE